MAMSLPQPDCDYLAASSSGPVPDSSVTSGKATEPGAMAGAGRVAMQRLSPAKRAVDVVVALVLLVLVAPLIGVLAVIIMLDSRGAPFFVQTRVGHGGREFPFIKLRTMVQDAEARLGELINLNEAQPPLFKMKRDPRVTRIGAFLRRSSLDELPQLWNVVRGDMSLVGPRPSLPREVATYTPEQMRRLSVIPGMTGLWQVSGRSDLDFEHAVALDLSYIDTWSMVLDLTLLIKTLLVVVRPRGAY
ncbi:MAG: sugar transferase [Candidatus Dormibacteraeota bacterium]|nr:sugar transferase [Candidatus Dormibacteraeota bacterium]MBO0744753.1 sugar transferase [Candidatus Dormibacteraeota bacterium]